MGPTWQHRCRLQPPPEKLTQRQRDLLVVNPIDSVPNLSLPRAYKYPSAPTIVPPQNPSKDCPQAASFRTRCAAITDSGLRRLTVSHGLPSISICTIPSHLDPAHVTDTVSILLEHQSDEFDCD
jgi:hypothetical protein